MNLRNVKKIMCNIFLIGFFGGILYFNIFAKHYLLSEGIFDEYYMEQYSSTEFKTSSYIWYIIKIRVIPVIFCIIIASRWYGKFMGYIFLMWTGFASGTILTLAVFRFGIKGILLCIVGVLPHFICYITVYMVLFTYLLCYPDVRWNSTKTVSVVLFLLLGIITETYINPVLMDIFIKTI